MIFKTQTELFRHVYTTRKIRGRKRCSICEKMLNSQPKALQFPHFLAKGQHPKYKFDSNNVTYVCSLRCHHLVDYLKTGINAIVADKLEQGEEITIDRLLQTKGITREEMLDHKTGYEKSLF